MSGTGALTLNGPGEFWAYGNGLAAISPAGVRAAQGWPGGIIIVNNGTLMQDSIPSHAETYQQANGQQCAGQYELFAGTAGTTTYTMPTAGSIITLSGTGETGGYNGALLSLGHSSGSYTNVLNNNITLASTASIIVGEYTRPARPAP